MAERKGIAYIQKEPASKGKGKIFKPRVKAIQQIRDGEDFLELVK